MKKREWKRLAKDRGKYIACLESASMRLIEALDQVDPIPTEEGAQTAHRTIFSRIEALRLLVMGKSKVDPSCEEDEGTPPNCCLEESVCKE